MSLVESRNWVKNKCNHPPHYNPVHVIVVTLFWDLLYFQLVLQKVEPLYLTQPCIIVPISPCALEWLLVFILWPVWLFLHIFHLEDGGRSEGSSSLSSLAYLLRTLSLSYTQCVWNFRSWNPTIFFQDRYVKDYKI